MLLIRRRAATLGVAVLIANACVGYAMKAPYHTVEINNAGKATVYDYRVIYGDHRLPPTPKVMQSAEDVDARPDTGSPRAFAAGGSRGYSMEVPVPEVATVFWTTGDGEQHQETVEIRRHVKDKGWFDGEGEIAFEVDGATLKVYLVRNRPGSFDEEREQIH